MFSTLCVRGFAAALLFLAAVTAAPSFASTVPATSVATPAAVAAPAATITSTVQPTAGTIRLPAVSQPAPAARAALSLHDRVLAFVDYGKQDEQLECLAGAVYFEARGEPLEGQLAVAQVVLNRAASGVYPPSICDVVTQPAQFSFIRGGKFPKIDKSSDLWHRALAIADIARKKLAREIESDVLWYHANYVAPSWGRRLTRVAQLGRHIFYN